MVDGMSLASPAWASDTATDLLTLDGVSLNLPVWTARNRKERNTGLLGTDGIDGAVWITRCNSVHTFGMRYPIDVVYVSRGGRVRGVVTMQPRRLGLVRFTASATVEMAAGLAGRLGIARGRRVGRASQ